MRTIRRPSVPAPAAPAPASPAPAARRSAPWLLLAALAWALLLAPPAHADAHTEGELCTGEGVNVIVDFRDLGGGIRLACDEAGAGKVAAQVFEDTGFDLTPVGAFPGAACQVDGKPEGISCAEMPPADAYWGLFLATDGTWGYAPKGTDELTLDEGAVVGFSWQGSDEPAAPGVEPTEDGLAAAQESAAAAAESEQAEGDGSGEAGTAEESGDAGSTPWWVPVGVVVLLLVVAGAALARRRGSDRSA